VQSDATVSHDDDVQPLNNFLAAIDAERDRMDLTSCWQLQDAKFRNQIHISPEQEKKLRQISAASRKQQAKFTRDLIETASKLPPDKIQAVETGMNKEFWSKLQQSERKQVYEVLTAAQRSALKREMAKPAVVMLHYDPNSYKSLRLTQQQREKIAQIGAEEKKQNRAISAAREERNEAFLRGFKGDRHAKALALVVTKYRESLLGDAVAQALPDEQGNTSITITNPISGSASANVEKLLGTINVNLGVATSPPSPLLVTGTNVGGTSFYFNYAITPAPVNAALAKLPFFGEPLSQSENLDKEWGIKAAQAKQLAEIAKTFEADQDRILKTIDGLSAADRMKRKLELLGEYDMLKTRATRRAEEVLTPLQIAAVKETLLRWHGLQYLVEEPASWRAIGVDEKEIAAMNAAATKEGDAYNKISSETSERILDVLTPQQLDSLLEEFEKRNGG
jgi:hypothetical protein